MHGELGRKVLMFINLRLFLVPELLVIVESSFFFIETPLNSFGSQNFKKIRDRHYLISAFTSKTGIMK